MLPMTPMKPAAVPSTVFFVPGHFDRPKYVPKNAA
jgi:hypothetical protein